ncbi:hypothetical protein [Streptomyces sp. NPDC057677]|uniref:hypothetical protein n=1 Tax=unclassified Streptomyces TaxID=2593676 RepID=UPI0036AD2944
MRLESVPLTGFVPSQVEDWLVHRTTQPENVAYSVAGDPVFADLGLVLQSQRPAPTPARLRSGHVGTGGMSRSGRSTRMWRLGRV